MKSNQSREKQRRPRRQVSANRPRRFTQFTKGAVQSADQDTFIKGVVFDLPQHSNADQEAFDAAQARLSRKERSARIRRLASFIKRAYRERQSEE